MRERSCDVAVIGAGTAGIAAHRAALDAGVRAVLIEQGPGGTTCARVGCMPSKLLITAAEAAHQARAAHRLGIDLGAVRVDGPAVLARMRALRDRFVHAVLEGLDGLPEETRLTGRAVFEGPDSLLIDDHTRLRFKAAVLATGSSPSVPEPLRGLGKRVLTTDSVFEIETLPASLAVLGAGPVGLELAQAMGRLGVATSVFDPGDSLGGLGDPELKRAAREIFSGAFDLHLGAKVESGAAEGEGARLGWSGEEGTGERTFDRVLAAAGRPPNVSGIGLEKTGVALDDRGGPVHDPRSLLCEGAKILIAGDANADRPVLHEASRQGRIAGRNAARLARGEAAARPERWVALAMVFSDPQIAVIGGGYDPEADHRVGRADFCDQGRARVMDRAQGGIRLYAEADGRLAAAELVGPEVEHLAHLLAYAAQDGLDVRRLRDRPFYHPTLEEGLETALSDLADR
ncbi:dihydrolipoyl dehydrogenase [Methylorubrum populi]|uniref:dihydrolipoyl dehydrogenase n=1 Tax=Methylorubrum rhodesianum TaxID=29427 RepID=UPI00190BBF15|nr:dihydrolipoyl dehydrogenase [Methylorubrum rhodesianum]MBK3405777.1 dihydrolipoyl dehydrogenase [Methylorubrum rhodesianum]MBY0139036.1 dihydrolipoyl dehydrogenase [Methylorubrum populi]